MAKIIEEGVALTKEDDVPFEYYSDEYDDNDEFTGEKEHNGDSSGGDGGRTEEADQHDEPQLIQDRLPAPPHQGMPSA